MIKKDQATWQRVTADHRRIEVKNRILSEKKPFPAALFEMPALPPSLKNLKFLALKQKGATAKTAYFGLIDFGVGGNPTENLIVLSYVKATRGWVYDKADFVNLNALPEVRKELKQGNTSYLSGVPEAQPSGKIPPSPIEIKPVSTIAKVYVFCPGREVTLSVNKVSRHRFANDKQAEVVIGGARTGQNEVQYSVRSLEGSTGKEPLVFRVYLLSERAGVKPVIAFEYLIKEGEKPKPFGTGNFFFDAKMAEKIK